MAVKPKTTVLLETFILAALLVFAAVLDSEFGAASFWRFDLIFFSLGLLILLPGAQAMRRKSVWRALLSFNLALLVLPFTCFSTTKSFIQFSRAIHSGMTSAEVKSILEARYPFEGRFPRPEAQWEGDHSVRYFMDPSHDRVDSIAVNFQNGRVVTLRYFGD